MLEPSLFAEHHHRAGIHDGARRDVEVFSAVGVGQNHVAGDAQVAGGVDGDAILIVGAEHDRVIRRRADERSRARRLDQHVDAAVLRDREAGIDLGRREHGIHAARCDRRRARPHLDVAVGPDDDAILIVGAKNQRMIRRRADKAAGAGSLKEHVDAAVLRDRDTGIDLGRGEHAIHPAGGDGRRALAHVYVAVGLDDDAILIAGAQDQRMRGRRADETAGSGRLQKHIDAVLLRESDAGVHLTAGDHDVDAIGRD